VRHGWRCVCYGSGRRLHDCVDTAPCVPSCTVRLFSWRRHAHQRAARAPLLRCSGEVNSASVVWRWRRRRACRRVCCMTTPCATIHPCVHADVCAADVVLHGGVQPYTPAGMQQAKCLAESIYCMLLQLFIGDADSGKESLYYRDFNHVLSTNRRHR
jgi:hypothetical protein